MKHSAARVFLGLCIPRRCKIIKRKLNKLLLASATATRQHQTDV